MRHCCGFALLLLALQLPAQTLLPDSNFGNQGTRNYDWGFDWLQQLKIDPQGRILMAGTGGSETNPDLALTRLLPNGNPDSEFGFGGRVEIDLGDFERATAVHIDPSNRIVLAGTSTSNQGELLFCAFHENGLRDSSFGTFGIARFSHTSLHINGPIAELISDGQSGYFASFQGYIESTQGFGIVHLLANGSFDPNWSQGFAFFAVNGSPDGFEKCMLLQPNGSLLLAGSVYVGNVSHWLLFRILPNGAPDPDFQNSGVLEVQPVPQASVIRSMHYDSNQRIVLGGYAPNFNGADQSILLRLLPNGSPDPDFGNNGIQIPPAIHGARITDMALRENAHWLATGPGSESGFNLMEFLASGDWNSDFGTNGCYSSSPTNAEATTMVLLPGDSSVLMGGSDLLAQNPDVRLQKFRILPDAASLPNLEQNRVLPYPNPASHMLFIPGSSPLQRIVSSDGTPIPIASYTIEAQKEGFALFWNSPPQPGLYLLQLASGKTLRWLCTGAQ
jgi:uncharacterized delta-60 repeat protein